jgi:hypothetical protein
VEPLTGPVLAAVVNAIASHVSGQLTGAMVKGLRSRILGNPEQKALGRALERAYIRVADEHRETLAGYDVNPSFLRLEGAGELAKALIPGTQASASKLADLCVDSLTPQLDDDTRWNRVVELRPVFKMLIDTLREEIGRERFLDHLATRVEESRAAASAERLVQHFGATPATEVDRTHYLHWLIERHRYIRTSGMVRNTTVQIPLRDVFVDLVAQADPLPGERAHMWLAREQKKLQSLLESGELDQVAYKAEIERVTLQFGDEVRRRGHKRGRNLDDEPTTIMDAAKNSPHLLILGDPGAGKTTSLRYLALSHAEALASGSPRYRGELGEVRFPIYVRIGDFARSHQRALGLGSFLAAYLKSQECRAPGLADLLERRLGGGECLVLLDGLDEVASTDDRRSVIEAVTNFATAVSGQGNRFVVTSRIAGYLAAPLSPTFRVIRMKDMDGPTIKRFLNGYCPAIERAEAPEKSDEAVDLDAQASAAALIEALARSPGIRRLAASPLLLTALLLVHRAQGRLPHRRVDAYVEVAEALGRNWRSVQDVPEADLPDYQLLTSWLTRLGAWLHERRPEGVAVHQVVGVSGRS